jgi:hypothetical protein
MVPVESVPATPSVGKTRPILHTAPLAATTASDPPTPIKDKDSPRELSVGSLPRHAVVVRPTHYVRGE